MQEIKRVEIEATTQFETIMSQHFLELDEAAQTNLHHSSPGPMGPPPSPASHSLDMSAWLVIYSDSTKLERK